MIYIKLKDKKRAKIGFVVFLLSTAFALKWLLRALLYALNSFQDLIFKGRQLKAIGALY